MSDANNIFEQANNALARKKLIIKQLLGPDVPKNEKVLAKHVWMIVATGPGCADFLEQSSERWQNTGIEYAVLKKIFTEFPKKILNEDLDRILKMVFLHEEHTVAVLAVGLAKNDEITLFLCHHPLISTTDALSFFRTIIDLGSYMPN